MSIKWQIVCEQQTSLFLRQICTLLSLICVDFWSSKVFQMWFSKHSNNKPFCVTVIWLLQTQSSCSASSLHRFRLSNHIWISFTFDQFVRHCCWISLHYRQAKMKKQYHFLSLPYRGENRTVGPPGCRKLLQTGCLSHQWGPGSRDPVPAGVWELLVGVHDHTGYKLLSCLLHWLCLAGRNPPRQHIRGTLLLTASSKTLVLIY